MEKIDWSKAPEGYPLWIRDLDATRALDQSGWNRDDGDRYTDESGRYWYKIDGGSYSVHQRPSQSWSGEGLPPVGVVCEVTMNDGYNWKKTSILFADDCMILLEGYELFRAADPDVYFRPIRTPEQIAKDEREAAIRAIVYDLQDAENLSSLPSIANCLYAKGYRKP